MERPTPNVKRLHLLVEGDRKFVEEAVNFARGKSLAPQYMAFSVSNPNIRWKAKLSVGADPHNSLSELIKAGWVL